MTTVHVRQQLHFAFFIFCFSRSHSDSSEIKWLIYVGIAEDKLGVVTSIIIVFTP